jgi:hypothetical protein
VSGVPLINHLDDREESRHQQLLALRRLRGGLERRPPGEQPPWWREPVALEPEDIARELHELIEALDRRVPRVEQAGEASIARDAAALREKALKRLTQLRSSSAAGAPEAGE